MFEMKNIQGEEKDMTLLAYQVFLAVVEQESFQKAAQVLNLTPVSYTHLDVYKRQNQCIMKNIKKLWRKYLQIQM